MELPSSKLNKPVNILIEQFLSYLSSGLFWWSDIIGVSFAEMFRQPGNKAKDGHVGKAA